MTRNFSELRQQMSPDSQARAQERAEKILTELALADVRRAREQTQQQLASALQVNQAWISKIERQTDMYVSTLRDYITALGGELEIVARFPNCVARIKQFRDLNMTSRTTKTQSITIPVNVTGDSGGVSVWIEPKRAIQTDEASVRLWGTSKSNTPSRSTTPGNSGSRAA